MKQTNRISLNRLLLQPWVPYTLLLFSFLHWHYFISLAVPGDDRYFFSILDGISCPEIPQTLLSFAVDRYQTWSSRVVIEVFLVLLSRAPLLWRVLDAMLMVSIPLSLDGLLNRKRSLSVSWALCTGMMLFPRNILSAAGYISTSVNYIWPLALGLLALIPLFQTGVLHKKASPLAVAAGLMALLFATNQEQMCLILLGFEAVLLVIHRMRGLSLRKASPIHAAYLLVTLLALVFILICPGNQARYQSEVQSHFPGFDSLSLFRRFEICFSSTGFFLLIPSEANYSYMPFNYIFLLLCFLLALVTYPRAKGIDRIASLAPLIAILVFGPLSSALSPYFPHLAHMGINLTETGTNPTPSSISSLVPDAILLFVFFCVLYDLWVFTEDKQTALLSMIILMAGLASRFVLMFSPTIWVSGERTCIFMYVSLIALSPLLIEQLEANGQNRHSLAVVHNALPLIFLLFFLDRIAR